MSKEKIVIGCDHAGLDLKAELIEKLSELGFEAIDCGCYTKESVDYPDIAEAVCNKINSGECNRGVLICGTGIGISMSANKIHGIRAALCHDSFSAKYTRLHNNSNVICFGARVIGSGLACELLEIFLNTGFEGGRHELRIEKLMKLN